jgi:hypothetical protein
LETWAPIGSQNVHLLVNGSENDSFTVMAAITAAQTKLPLCMTAAGKTPLVEHSYFGDVACHRTMHSESGWQTAETFAEWFGWLRSLYPDGEPIWLILDAYSVHRQETIRAYVEDLRIHVLFIPQG